MAPEGLSAKLSVLLPPFFNYIKKKGLLSHPLPQLVPFTTFFGKVQSDFFSPALVTFPA